MLLPFVGWTITGAIFFLKPGYAGAYEPLSVRTYPLDDDVRVPRGPGWHEVRVLRTVLGAHLLVRTDEGWRQVNVSDGSPRQAPLEEDLRRLLTEAVSSNPERYGKITTITPTRALTSTGVEIDIDWDRLLLRQRGADTARIDWLYRIHYLQWTGVEAVDRVAGGVGLALVALLTGLGARLAFGRRVPDSRFAQKGQPD